MNLPFGIMFHHFHGGGHPMVQGSISAEQLAQLIEKIGRENILDCDVWMKSALKGTLTPEQHCLTFDDNLRSQFTVALPVLEHYQIRAFWFIPTLVLAGGRDKLEIYRHFRTTGFDSIQEFYDIFDRYISDSSDWAKVFLALKMFNPDRYLSEHPFYSDADKRFRFIRDQVLGEEKYSEIMDSLLQNFGFDEVALTESLWMNPDQLRLLHKAGHEIGLHSHTHPTQIASLDRSLQKKEYETNSEVLNRILETRPCSMSHPCNSYGKETLQVLKEIGIQLGFRANGAQNPEYGPLEFPREDHANLIRRLAL